MDNITAVLVPNRKQSGGDVVIDAFPYGVKWIQIDAECSATPSGGTLEIKFKTPHMQNAKRFVDSGSPVSIDLTNPYPVRMENIAIEELVLTPVGFDTDKTFSVSASWEKL